MRDISAEEVHKLVDGDENAVLIDVLSPNSFATRHIPRSVSIPETDPKFLERVEKKVPTKDTPVVVYCASGQRSAVGASLLKAHGARDVIHVVDGGVGTWEKLGSPIERQ